MNTIDTTTLPGPEMEFHISRMCREKYTVSETLFSTNGNAIFTNFNQVRLLTQKMNDLSRKTGGREFIQASDLNAMGLIDEILHVVMQAYLEEVDADALKDCLNWIEQTLGKKKLEKTLLAFAEEFPVSHVYKTDVSAQEYLSGKTAGTPNHLIVLEELLHLWLANSNPAYSPAGELFDDTQLNGHTAYAEIIQGMRSFFDTRPGFGPDNLPLIEMLRSPAMMAPDSLSAQLQFIASRWSSLLSRHGGFLLRLMRGMDFITEEMKVRGIGGPGPVEVVDFTAAANSMDVEEERFSPDSDWMPNLVMIARNALVWLDQLSRKYDRHIHHLDEIPDEELDLLAARGFTGLWLIGLWERSTASKRIKQLCGNPEAESSAYSLMDYHVADRLGGEEASQTLKQRCWERGIRLACDMVPNHTGLDSNWMINHPDWFLSRQDCPYPNYSFTGENLSKIPGIGLQIEDHYYNRTDAAVVFKREDYHNGDVRFIYHGNDGTSMPWNDTAQLNYLNAGLREVVIQTIIGVARRYPIIRFDAAMTLAKRHFHRLWFPEPGSGGDIPTRSEAGLTHAQFNEAFPVEFWREVVDRIAEEVPDTLLLAEAFWMMEGYFVRTLGMHRVYNSAFMNMLKTEDNAKFRQMIKNTLEFDPEILKRYVNFMSNPDEETAVRQFGKGDKYFGICTLMSTMPGLPMFAHGQVEGLEEKYGMEYSRAYWDEQPDSDLVRRHEHEIFPLMHKRFLFAGVHNFRLYDLFTGEGNVNENVIAYSNRHGLTSSLVIYNNSYERASGWIKTSAAFRDKHSGQDSALVQQNLAESLGVDASTDSFVIFRDQCSGLEYIRRTAQLRDEGLYLECNGFQTMTFLDFQFVEDSDLRAYHILCEHLNGRGVSNIQHTLEDMLLLPIHNAFRSFFNASGVQLFMNRQPDDSADSADVYGATLEEQYTRFLNQVADHLQLTSDPEAITSKLLVDCRTISELDRWLNKITPGQSPATDELLFVLKNRFLVRGILMAWLTTRHLGELLPETTAGHSDLYTQLKLDGIVHSVLRETGCTGDDLWLAERLIPVLNRYAHWQRRVTPVKQRPYHVLKQLVNEPPINQFLGVNTWEDVTYYNAEAFESLIQYLYLLGILDLAAGSDLSSDAIQSEMESLHSLIHSWKRAHNDSDFNLDLLLKICKD